MMTNIISVDIRPVIYPSGHIGTVKQRGRDVALNPQPGMTGGCQGLEVLFESATSEEGSGHRTLPSASADARRENDCESIRLPL